MYQTPTRPITSAETSVLACLIAGDSPSNKAIGTELGMSENTVRAHLRSVTAKIGVRGRIAVAVWAAEYMRDKPHRQPVRL